ncbi:MAG: bacterio-opsin activator domain-containing protein [Halobacteriales archaeon]
MTASESEHLPTVAFDLKQKAMDEAPVGITISDVSLPDNPLVYVNDAFVRTTGYSKEFALGRNCRFLQGEDTREENVAEMARAVEERESTTVEVRNYTKAGEEFWNEVTIAPLRNDAGEVTHFVGFQADVTDRKRAEMTVERERENLAHLLDRINGLLEGVTSELVEGVNRTEIEEAVCACITETTPYTTAWIGETDVTGDHLEPTATAGNDSGLVPESRVEVDGGGDLKAALQSGDLRVLRAEQAFPDDRQSTGEVTVVPLTYGDAEYGALFVHATGVGTFNDREMAVLESLGRMVATALNAHESKRIISTDNVVEMELLISDQEFFFVDLAARSGSAIEYAGSVYSDGSPNTFVTTDGDPESIVDLAGDAPEIDEASIVGTEAGSALIELHVATESIVAELADRGAKTNTITATEGEAHLEIELPAGADARSIVQRIKDRHPQTELRRYQERERPPTTKREFIADLEDRLTDQQFTALQRAYVGGYYDWDRGTNGDELANSMGVSRPTFHQHLRAAERKLVEEFFGG